MDRQIAHRLQNPRTQENRFLSRSATGFRVMGFPGSLGIAAALYIVGRVDNQRRLQDLGLHGTEAILIGAGVTTGIKVLAGRARPFLGVDKPRDFQLGRGFSEDDYRSFPSGHTTVAFAFASTMSRETQMWWPGSRWYLGGLLYGSATMVGMSRMYNNVHWASDVLGGAAIGTIVGLKVVKYHHSHPGNAIDRALLRATSEPTATALPIITLRFR